MIVKFLVTSTSAYMQVYLISIKSAHGTLVDVDHTEQAVDTVSAAAEKPSQPFSVKNASTFFINPLSSLCCGTDDSTNYRYQL